MNFLEAFTSLCLFRYVSYAWETNGLFLGTPNHCSPYHNIHWWFDRSPWLDLSGLVLIHFPSIYLFFPWYFIRLGYIVLHTYLFIFRVWYFSHTILIHPISSSILFLSSLSSLIYSSWILSSSLIYSYWMSSDQWFVRLSTHIAFYTRGYGVYHWVFESCFLSFLSPYYLSLRYVPGLKTTLRPRYHALYFDSSHVAILGIGWRALWLW